MAETGNKLALKKYVNMAYERELREGLIRLSPHFNALESSAFDVLSLKETLDNFIKNDVKRLDTTYSIADPAYALAYAIRRGVLALDEVPCELHHYFYPLLNTEKM